MATEQKVFPIDPSTLSWRDKLRNLATAKYGNTGRQFSEAILGESEEEKYMNYLEKIEAGLLPPPKNFSPNRPVSDMLGGEGISDFGLLDAGLMGLSGAAIPKISTGAALTESGVLGADAVGEYKKGNTTTAAIMGTLAGAPPLLRYANPVKNTSSKEVAEEVQPDLTRRKVVQGLGITALAAPFADPLVMAARKISKAPGLVKLTPSIPNLVDSPIFHSQSRFTKLARLKTINDAQLKDNLDYAIDDITADIFNTLNKTKNVDKLEYKDIKKLFLEEAKNQSVKYPWTQPYQNELSRVVSSDKYIKNVLETYEEGKNFYKNNPTIKSDVDVWAKIPNMSHAERVKYLQKTYPDDWEDIYAPQLNTDFPDQVDPSYEGYIQDIMNETGYDLFDKIEETIAKYVKY